MCVCVCVCMCLFTYTLENLKIHNIVIIYKTDNCGKFDFENIPQNNSEMGLFCYFKGGGVKIERNGMLRVAYILGSISENR